MNLDSDEINRLRNIIKYEIRSRALNYRSLSRSTGISYLKIRRIMTKQDPKLSEFLKILKFLKIDIFKIFEDSQVSDSTNKMDAVI